MTMDKSSLSPIGAEGNATDPSLPLTTRFRHLSGPYRPEPAHLNKLDLL